MILYESFPNWKLRKQFSKLEIAQAIFQCKTFYTTIFYNCYHEEYIMNVKLYKGSRFLLCSMFIMLIAGCPMPEPEPTPGSVPDAPTGLTLTAGDAALTVDWDAPADNGSPITGYELQYRSGEGAWAEITEGIGTNTSHAITGLTNGAAYDVQARAVNAVGAGDWSESAAATPAAVPDAPAAPTLYAGTGRIIVRWTTPDDGGSPITEYELQYRAGSGAWMKIAPAPGTHDHSITDLTNGTAYDVQARAVNAVGSGNWSESATAMPLRIQTPAGTAKSVSLSDAVNAVIIASENLSVYLITGTHGVDEMSGDITVTSTTPPGAFTPPIINIAHVFNESIGIVTVTENTTAGIYLVYGETETEDILFAEYFSVTVSPTTNAQLDTAVTDGIAAWGPTADFNYIVTAAVTDMSTVFGNKNSFNGDISLWDTGAVTNMNGMFAGTGAFNGDISGWDVSSVTNMTTMFYSAVVFNGDISGWDVSSVMNISYMFFDLSAFNQDLEAWGDHWTLNANGKYTGTTTDMFKDSGVIGDLIPSWYE